MKNILKFFHKHKNWDSFVEETKVEQRQVEKGGKRENEQNKKVGESIGNEIYREMDAFCRIKSIKTK